MRTLATSTSRAGGMAPTSCTRKMAQHPESGYLLEVRTWTSACMNVPEVSLHKKVPRTNTEVESAVRSRASTSEEWVFSESG